MHPGQTGEDHLSHLLVVRPADGEAEALARTASSIPPFWLGISNIGEHGPDGTRRFLIDMLLPVGDGRSIAFRKATAVDLAPSRNVADGWVIPISWRAITLQPLFPVFSGELRITKGEVRLEGRYAPPGGQIGRLADRLLMHLAAERTGRWLVGRLVDATP
jgi:hypothetical protein